MGEKGWKWRGARGKGEQREEGGERWKQNKIIKGEDTAGNARKHNTVPSTFVYRDVFRAMITNTDIHAYIGHKT